MEALGAAEQYRRRIAFLDHLLDFVQEVVHVFNLTMHRARGVPGVEEIRAVLKQSLRLCLIIFHGRRFPQANVFVVGYIIVGCSSCGEP